MGTNAVTTSGWPGRPLVPPAGDIGDFAAEFDGWEKFWNESIGRLTRTAEHEGNVSSFDCHITKIRFRGLAHVPVLIAGKISPEIRQALSLFVSKTPAASLGIVVCLTAEAFAFVRNSPVLPRARFVLLGPEEASELRLAGDPVDFLRRQFLSQIPYYKLIPYSISEPTEGGMFVGRRQELQMLMHTEQDFALCGAGGVGKTSLLRQMQWVLRQQRDPRSKRVVEVVWLNCPVSLDAAANSLAISVVPSMRAQSVTCSSLAKFLKQVRKSDSRFDDGPIDLIIDETDEILALDRRTLLYGHKYPLMKQLRTARLQGSIRLTISGRNETNLLFNDSDNPFTVSRDDPHAGEVRTRFKLLSLGPLDGAKARELLELPLKDLDYPVDAQAVLLEKRLKEARGIPVNIQSAGLDLAIEAARGQL